MTTLVLALGGPSPAQAAGPAVSVASTLSVVEGTTVGSQVLRLSVGRSGPAAETCNLVATVVLSGSATAGDFVTLNPQNFLFNAADSSREINAANVVADSLVESDETFSIVLSGAAFSSFPACDIDPAADTVTVTLVDDDTPAPPPPPVRSISVSDVSSVEGNTGTTTVTFALNLDGPANGNESVTVATSNGSATAGSDFLAVPATVVSFSAGQTTRPVSITINGDTTVEPDETFTLVLSAPANVTITDGTGLGTITNDDNAPPTPTATVSIKDASDDEENSGSSSLAFTVKATAKLSSTCGFSFTVAHGTTNSADLDTAAGSGEIKAGKKDTKVKVTVYGDRTVEPDETFTVTIVGSGSNPCVVSDGVAIGTIENDDRSKGKGDDDHDRPKKPWLGRDKC